MKKTKKATILNETTIRRFMKLANIAPLTENYLGQFTEEDEEPEMEMGGEPEMGAEPDADMGDMDAAPAEGGASSVSQEAVEEIVQAIASAVEEVTGTSVSAAPAAAEAPADMGDVEAEPEMEMGGDEEPDPATRYEEAKHSDEEETEVEEGKKAYKREEDEEVDEAKEEDDEDAMKSEQLINRIAKKVVERLQREMK